MKSIPTVGYCTWNRPENAVTQVTTTEFDAGYRYLDCTTTSENEGYVRRAIADLAKLTTNRGDCKGRPGEFRARSNPFHRFNALALI
jgi:diketogulonate reductase-like aldo/keto reductase